MEIFHYVANQLKSTPLFESNIETESTKDRIGAVYNDYDQECPFDIQPTPEIRPIATQTNSRPVLAVRDIDHATIEADNSEGIFTGQMSRFDGNEFADFTSEEPNEEYYKKVYIYIHKVHAYI